MRLTGRFALVTGGGIGEAIACRLAAAGAAVVVAGHHTENITQVATSIGEYGGEAIAVQVDVADAAVRNAVALASERFGPLDIAVANAALAGAAAYQGPFAEITDEAAA